MKILVTGANGYIGYHLTKQLLDCGHEVIAVDLKHENIDPRATIIHTDIFDKNSNNLYFLFGEPDALIHLACKDVPKHNSLYHIESLPYHFNFIKDLIDSGLKQVITVGSLHDVGYFEGMITENTPPNPQNFYGISKDTLRRLVCVYAREKNIVHQHLRFFYTYGDDEKSSGSVFSKILELEKAGECKFPFTDGKNKFDYIEINELTKQITAVVEQKKVSGIIHCCSGKAITIKEQVENYIKTKKLKIRPDYGKYPSRIYDSPCVYGDTSKIDEILKNRCL